MILGIGTDIVDNKRIASVVSKHGDRFIKKLFSARERKIFQKFKGDEQKLGTSFAAKESLVKAMGTGFRYGISFLNIEVLRGRHGKPLIKLSGKAEEVARAMGVKRIHLSMSNEKSHSLAVVILES